MNWLSIVFIVLIVAYCGYQLFMFIRDLVRKIKERRSKKVDNDDNSCKFFDEDVNNDKHSE